MAKSRSPVQIIEKHCEYYLGHIFFLTSMELYQTDIVIKKWTFCIGLHYGEDFKHSLNHADLKNFHFNDISMTSNKLCLDYEGIEHT